MLFQILVLEAIEVDAALWPLAVRDGRVREGGYTMSNRIIIAWSS